MTKPSLNIDGDAVVAGTGETILAVARRTGHGGNIPTLCYTTGLSPQGGCRLCVVAIEGQAAPVAACTTLARPGMIVTTASPELEGERRELLRLLLDAHPRLACEPHPAGGRQSGEFRALLRRHGLDRPATQPASVCALPEGSHPYLRFQPDFCVTCRRCVQACDDVQGQFVFAIGGRGAQVRLLVGGQDRFEDSPCVSCGACVEACPTGALSDMDRLRMPPVPAGAVVRSVCGYCGVGCNIDVSADAGGIRQIAGSRESSVNAGHLCAKGRYAHGWTHSPERLTVPLLKEGTGFREISWAEAIAHAARELQRITGSSGPDSLGVMTSSRSTNESAYLFQKLFRAVIGTNNVDCCARVCHSSTALALSIATGTSAASASYADIEQAHIIVIAGANPTEAHPVVGARIKQAVRRGARLMVIDPRHIELCDYASLHLPIEPGTNVAVFNALAAVLIEEGLWDRAYVEERTEGFGSLREALAGESVDAAAASCGVPAQTLREAARLLATSGPALFVTGLGLSELTQGTDSVLALINVALLTGSIGKAGAGMLPLRGQNNVQGNADMGSAPGSVTGYQPTGDPLVRARLHRHWGAVPPEGAGLTIPGMLAAARAGTLRGLWVQGEDLMQSDPNQAAVRAALCNLDFLVVQELFMTETARLAHLVLPAAGALEQDGTFTNGERRIQRVRAALRPPGEARPDWSVAVTLARAMGAPWDYANPAGVMDEIAAVAPELFGGIAYSRLDGDGLQWPCPDPSHPGTAIVHAAGFMRGRGLFSIVSHQGSSEQRTEEWPFILITGRVLQHYNVGSMTRRTPNLRFAGADVLVVHPDDARSCGVGPGDWVEIESRHGRTRVRARISDEVRPRTLFLSFHFPETRTNALTGSQVDPHSHCPDYKATAVRIRAMGRGMPSSAFDGQRACNGLE